jgi:hypothetical protein
MSFDDCARKFRDCAQDLKDDRKDKVIELVGKLEKSKDVTEIIRLLDIE